MPASSTLATDGLVKNSLAARLRAEIMSGTLAPGARIVEGKWAPLFGVAQGSVREAINLLAQDGFVTKESGRSARVIHFSERAVAQLYELRGVIEGSARLAVSALRILRLCRRPWSLCGSRQSRGIAKGCSITICDFMSNYASSPATHSCWSTRAASFSPFLHLCGCE
jgi:DNA-binding transcriptional regulator YhcF (GntR family)